MASGAGAPATHQWVNATQYGVNQGGGGQGVEDKKDKADHGWGILASVTIP